MPRWRFQDARNFRSAKGKGSLPAQLGVFIVFACVATAGFEAWQDYRAYGRELAKIASATANLAHSVLQHAEDTVEMADGVLVGLQERLQVDGTSPAALARLNRLLALEVKSLPRLKNLFVDGEDGRWLASSVPNLSPDLNNSDREYFQRLKASPGIGPYIGFPVHSRSTGEWIVPVARAFHHPDGRFAGVVNATVDVSYFADFYQRFDVGELGSIVLLRRDGRILARRPFKDDDIGRDMSGSLLFTEQLPKAMEGNYRAVSPVDHIDRLIGYHASNRFPLVSFGAVATSEALAGWRSDTMADAIIVAIIVATICLLGFLLVKELDNRTKDRAALAESEANFRLLAEYSSDVVSRIGRDHVRRYVSPACIRVLGYTPEELTGRSALDLTSPEHRDEVEQAIGRLWSRQAQEVVLTYRATKKDGSNIWLESSLRIARDASAQPDGVVAVTRDITERKQLESRLRELSRTDGLTGIPNRRAFEDALSVEWRRTTRENGASLSLALIDIDQFKKFNDGYGHPAGDDCLRLVASAIGATVKRPGDVAARFGGEEFALLLPSTDAKGAKIIAERVRAAVMALAIPHAGNSPRQVVTISIGIATMRSSGLGNEKPDAGILVMAADSALYEAKRLGRNRTHAAPPLVSVASTWENTSAAQSA
ncbi:MAG: diguanylate cyclase [Methylobacteriaceae bacterium]|nr:diguanylate cyclase [Methylobacteriaceae bacterium]